MHNLDKNNYNYSYLPDIVGHLSALVFVRATEIAMAHLAKLDLSTKEYVTLEFIANNPEVSQKSIAAEIGTKPSHLVNILDGLTRRGLLVRERSTSDRRKQYVRLTAKGEGLRDQIREAAFAADQELLEEAGMTAEEKEQMLQLLRKLADREIRLEQRST